MSNASDSKEAAQLGDLSAGNTPGEVLGVTKLEVVLVNMVDGYGKPQVRAAVVIPGGNVHYLGDKVLGKVAQKWVAEGIRKKLEK